jgi:hypothetical protein
VTQTPAELPDTDRGIYQKFRVERTDGRSAPGEKHFGCEYFVLDLTHDPHALPALQAYAEACAESHPVLADDLWTRIARLEREGPEGFDEAEGTDNG